MVKVKKNRAVLAPLITVLIAVLAMPALSGCFSGCFGLSLTAISFKQSQIDLNIGDVYTVTTAALDFEPALASNKNFTLESDDYDVVEIVGRQITAVGAGKATVTAFAEANPNITAEITVNVGYPTPTVLTLNTVGNVAQYVGKVSPVTFHAAADVELDPESTFIWKVDGETIENSSASYEFIPEDKAGEHMIEAELGECKAQSRVKVFTEKVENASAVSSGELEQNDDYTSVKLSVSYSAVDGDPEPFIDYYVNGKLYFAGGAKWSYTPEMAGIYSVTVKLNGEDVLIDGKKELVITARGSVTPTGVKASYNNVYPNIFVTWNCPHTENMNYGLKIEKIENGKVTQVSENITSSNISSKQFFDGTSVNLGELIDIKLASYRISVRSLGDNGIYTQSQYSESVTVNQINDKAVSTLENKVLGSTLDHYIVSDDEFNELYAYYMAFRKTASKVQFTVYMAYTPAQKAYSSVGEPSLLGNAFSYGATTGYYSTEPPRVNGKTVYSVKAGDVMTVTVGCDNTVVPSKSGDYSQTIRQYDALEPHTASALGKSLLRNSTHEFVTDTYSRYESVMTSEELFRAVEYGVRPVPVKGSTAEKLYSFAKRLLIEINSDDMTDAEKVHSIYDWIMWNVQYDHSAVSASNEVDSAKYNAYWLEGVLTTTNAYAVCDGMSKAMSLLCNMEGIPAYRVTGIAGPSVAGLTRAEALAVKNEQWGGHAWTKVKVDGEWYVCDPTWGDSTAEIGSLFSKTVYEMAWHDHLLVSDADIADTHEYDHTTNNPVTAAESYNIYDKMELTYTDSNGAQKKVDTFIDVGGSAMDAELREIADYIAYRLNGIKKSVTIMNSTKARVYFGIELAASDKYVSALHSTMKSSVNPLSLRLKEKGYRNVDVLMFESAANIMVTVKL